MKLVKVKCAFCGKKFFRESGPVNEAQKFDWKQFCSPCCLAKSRITSKILSCANPNCNKKVSRLLNQFRKSKSGRIFCSLSCAAIVNNLPKRKIKICSICGKQFYGERKYCSKLCRSNVVNPRKKSEDEKRKGILKKIKIFYEAEGRIPTKKEKPGLARRTQAVFGTWNNAIKIAGFEPNPVMFAKKCITKDGHKCDSFAEKIIDDWLFERKINHQKEIPYPENRLLSVDFVIKNSFIEYFGLKGVINEYDELIKQKRKLSKKYQFPLIEIYPKDLFPVNRLSEILKI